MGMLSSGYAWASTQELVFVSTQDVACGSHPRRRGQAQQKERQGNMHGAFPSWASSMQVKHVGKQR